MVMSISNSSTVLFHSQHVKLHDCESISRKVSPLMVSKAGEQLWMLRSRALVGCGDFIVYTKSSYLQHEHSENRCEMMVEGMEHTVPLAVCSPRPELGLPGCLNAQCNWQWIVIICCWYCFLCRCWHPTLLRPVLGFCDSSWLHQRAVMNMASYL